MKPLLTFLALLPIVASAHDAGTMHLHDYQTGLALALLAGVAAWRVFRQLRD